MSVTISWASNNLGTPITQPSSHGSIAKGNSGNAQTVYIYHNGVNNITSCGFYIQPFNGDYNGVASANDDYDELLEWGDSNVAANFGGFCVNMDATGTWADGWPTVINKNPTHGFVARTGVGDTLANAITVSSHIGSAGDGIIDANPPNGYGGNLRFQCRVQVPTNEGTLGKRQFDLVLTYSYTS